MCDGSGNNASAHLRESREISIKQRAKFFVVGGQGGVRTVPVEDDALARCGGDVASDVEVHAVAVERHVVVPKVLHAHAAPR